ncbi:response regulator [Shimia sagamensis]|uniref:Adenylate cyclase, class 3 n=1 Tax=Shimia sagamensis TaxID=1566352 RepID=A0ABY1NRQ4_9RHOB|nr:adenylate/guanylate cyclase domain-containing protein [Shimia sagamensis]SMP16511.1 Adenylate cyclase, class 3 [Shimia sagamensis]
MDEIARVASSPDVTPTILCVDDEKIILTSLQEQLRNNLQGVAIEIAESGEEGLEVLQELIDGNVPVPLVISDQLMPGMRGEEFLEKTHAMLPDALNVLLTGQATADSVGEAVNRANLYRYIGKPWSEDDLILTIKEALIAWGRARDLRAKEKELRETHEASLRFVPREFLSVLGKQRVVDVEEGHAVEIEMQVVFADMRSFSIHAANLGPRQAFDLLNEYINILDAVFREAGGFIGGLEGDGVLALFPGTVDEAVQAGVAAQQILLERGRSTDIRPGIDMGLAVHTGVLILGTVGNSERLKCDVIGDPVNFCARLESMTRDFDTPMLISDEVASALKSKLSLRRIPDITVKGRESPTTIYEVLDALPASQKQARISTSVEFDAAMLALELGEHETARDMLVGICSTDTSDRTAKFLLQRMG